MAMFSGRSAMRTLVARPHAVQQRRLEPAAVGDIDHADIAVALDQDAGELVGGAGEVGDEQIGRAVVDFVRRAHLQQLAVAHDADAVAEHHRLGLVVRDVERGHAGRLEDAAQVVAQPHAQFGVEVGQRLVEQQQLRPVDDAARQRDALHLPAGERDHRPLGVFRQADQLQHLVDLAVGSARADAAVLERIDDVLAHRHVRPHRIGLEHHADVALARRHAACLAPGDDTTRPPMLMRAGGRMLEAGDAAQRRGLAAAGRPEQHHDLAGRHVRSSRRRRPAGRPRTACADPRRRSAARHGAGSARAIAHWR